MPMFKPCRSFMIAVLPLLFACSGPADDEERGGTSSAWSKTARFRGPNGEDWDEQTAYCKGYLNPGSQTREEDCRDFNKSSAVPRSAPSGD